jgi:hypothetical protein
MLEQLLNGKSLLAGAPGTTTQLPKPTGIDTWMSGMGMCADPTETHIYIAGGYIADSSLTKKFARYTPSTGQWVELALPPWNPSGPYLMMACVGDNIIIITRNFVLVYSITNNTWVRKTDLVANSQFYSYMGTAAAYNGKMYMFLQPDNYQTYGAFVGSFDPVTGVFAVVSVYNPKVYWAYPGGDIVGDRFYMCGGGAPDTKKLYWYDLVSNTWGSRALPGEGQWSSRSVGHKGKLYMLAANGPALNAVWEYDPVLDVVNSLPDLPGTPAYSSMFGVAALKGKAYILGANKGQGFVSYQLPTA